LQQNIAFLLIFSEGGMFFWIKVLGVEDTWTFAMEEMSTSGILLVPGRAFSAFPDEPCPYLRASFSNPSDYEIEEGMRRLAKAISEHHDRIKK
jgi:DNA-binding transcriptional MocR family regulator